MARISRPAPPGDGWACARSGHGGAGSQETKPLDPAPLKVSIERQVTRRRISQDASGRPSQTLTSLELRRSRASSQERRCTSQDGRLTSQRRVCINTGLFVLRRLTSQERRPLRVLRRQTPQPPDACGLLLFDDLGLSVRGDNCASKFHIGTTSVFADVSQLAPKLSQDKPPASTARKTLSCVRKYCMSI